MKKIILSIITLVSIHSYSQVVMSTNSVQNQVSYLIDNVLIGNGVTTTNHQFTGDSSQIGYFTDSLGLI